MAVEPGGGAWVTGWTTSASDFPTKNAMQLNNAGGRDGFLLRVRVDGSTLDYGTLIGGARDDQPAAIALDSAGDVYIAGATASTDYPGAANTPGSWFATKFLWQPSTLKALIGYSRYLGAADNGGARTIQVDATGSAYICGATDSAAIFPLFGEPIASTPRGRFDIGFVRLDPTGEVIHASVLGGSRDDIPWHASYLSRYGDLFITGVTMSSDLPLTLGARDSILNASKGDTLPDPASDAFVMRFNFQRRPAIFSPISHTLDTLRCSDSATFDFRIYNVGDTDLVITGQFFAGSIFKLIPADSGDSTGVPRVVIPPGGSKPYRVLVPLAEDIQGVFSDYLTIVSNDSLAGRNPFIIRFTMVRARPVLTASPEAPSVRLLSCVADSLDFKVTIANKGVGDFTLAPIAFTANNGAFRLVDPKIPPGGKVIHDKSLTATVRFTPKRGRIGIDGIYRDTMVLLAVESRECGDTLRVPIEARVDSVVLAALDTAIHVGPLFACEPSAESWVHIENRGSTPVSIDSVTGTGFTLLTPLPHVIARGAVDSLRIVVTTQGPGIHRSPLTLRFNPCEGTLSLPLEVRRLPKDLLSADVPALDFGMIRGCAGREAAADTVIVLSRDPAKWDGDVTLFPAIGPGGFALSGGPTAPVPFHAADTVRIGVRYAPAGPGADSGILLIPYQAGPCVDTLRIRLSGARGDVELDVTPRDIILPDLICDLARDTTVTVINRSPFPVAIAAYRATEGISRVGSHPLSPVASGESFTVSFTLTPKRSGAFLDSLIFYSDPCGDSIVVVIGGNKEGAVIGFDRDAIAFTPLPLCELPDTLTASPLLRNTGSSGIATVRSVRINGSGSFAVTSDITGRQIGAGEVLALPVAFMPTSEGAFTAILEVVVTPCNDSSHLDTLRLPLSGGVLRGTIAVSGGEFGSVDLGTSRRADLVVKNTSSTPLGIDTLVNLVPPFTIVDSRPHLPATLAPGDSAVVTLEFTPTVSGLYRPTLSVITRTPCLDSTVAQLSGLAVATSEAAGLCIDGRHAGISGDTIEIPIVSATPGPVSGPVEITYTIGYDWRRLQFVGVSGGSVDLLDTSRPGASIVLRERGVTDLRSEQLRLRFRLLTGGDGDVAVRLDSVRSSSTDLLFGGCGDSAIVHISDRCVFTGVAPGKYANSLEPVRPNPAATTVALTYQQLEDARAVLRVFDAGGREVLRPLDADLPGGRYSIRFFVGDLPAGVYFYTLDVGAYHQSRKLLIER